MQNITAYQGEAHVTSDQFRSIIESIAGTGSYIADLDEQLEPELSTNNTLKIRSGVLIHHGHVVRVPPGTYDTVTYINGSQGMKRIDLVVARYEKNSGTKKEPTKWVVIQGTPDASSPVAPDYNEGNMHDGDLIDDCPVFEMHFDGLNVTEVKKLVAVTKNIDDLRQDVDKLNSTLSNCTVFLKSETAIGTWINGKTLYRKIINGNLDSYSQRLMFSTGLDLSCEYVTIDKTVIYDGKGGCISIPCATYSDLKFSCNAYIENNYSQFVIERGSEMLRYLTFYAVITYTK